MWQVREIEGAKEMPKYRWIVEFVGEGGQTEIISVSYGAYLGMTEADASNLVDVLNRYIDEVTIIEATKPKKADIGSN